MGSSVQSYSAQCLVFSHGRETAHNGITLSSQDHKQACAFLAILNKTSLLNGKKKKKFSWNCLTQLWPWNTVKVIESGMNRQSSVSSTIMQSLIFITFTVSEKTAMLKSFNTGQITRPAGPTQIITQAHISHKNQLRPIQHNHPHSKLPAP